MGILQKGINGGISGKVGNIVGAKWRDIYYVRSLPSKVNDPRTKAQLKQRSKFSTAIQFLKTITPFIRVGFQEYSTGKSTAFNAATSYHIKNAIIKVDAEIKLDYSKVLVSRGSLYTAPGIKVTKVNGQMHFTWDSTLKENARPSDMVMIVVYNSTKKEAIYTLCAGLRINGVTQLQLPSTWKEDIIYPYLSFRSDDGEIVSDSVLAKAFN